VAQLLAKFDKPSRAIGAAVTDQVGEPQAALSPQR